MGVSATARELHLKTLSFKLHGFSLFSFSKYVKPLSKPNEPPIIKYHATPNIIPKIHPHIRSLTSEQHNIAISASGVQTIDGSNFILLRSPFAAIQLYSNGSDSYFIY